MGVTSNYPPSITSINPNYLVYLWGTDEAGTAVNVWATLPAEFQIDTQSQWEPLLDNSNLAQNLGGAGASGVAKLAQAASGIQLNSIQATQLIWSGTGPIEFRVRLLFNAVTDAEKEVMMPLKSLLGLTLPSLLSGGTSTLSNLINLVGIRAPGPALSGSSYNIKMRIGRSFYFDNIIVKSVSATIDTMATTEGDFISAAADVDISTARVYTKSDLNNVFCLTNTSGNIPSNNTPPPPY